MDSEEERQCLLLSIRENPQKRFVLLSRSRVPGWLMAINLMKRMESSVYSFNLTPTRIKELIERTIETIDEYDSISKVSLDLTDISNIDEFDNDDQNGDELFSFGKKVKIELADMDYKSWKDSLIKDREILELLTLMVGDNIQYT